MSSETGIEQPGRKEGSARVQSKIHVLCYYELYDLSNTFIVLAFSEWPSLFERFCKEKKTKE